MTPIEFQKECLRTEKTPEYYNVGLGLTSVSAARLDHASRGMITEAGEMMDMLKKHFAYGKPFDRVNLLEELGDWMWYVSLATDSLGLSIETVLTPPDVYKQVSFPEDHLQDLHGVLPEGKLQRLDAAIRSLVNASTQVDACMIQAIFNEKPRILDIKAVLQYVSVGVFYVRMALECLGFTLEQAMETVVAKLRKRFPVGFTQEAALNRNLEAERAILEAGAEGK